jgi:hypothetical protein
MRTTLWAVVIAGALVTSCGGRDDQSTALPKPGQTVAFAQIRVTGMRSSVLTIREVDESGPAGKAAVIRARQGIATYRVFLAPGQYAVTGVKDPGDREGGGMTGGTFVFEITPGKAGYFGTFDMLIESGRSCAIDLSDAAFREAVAGFRKRYPDLAARFEIANAVATTDRIEADLAEDGGVEE